MVRAVRSLPRILLLLLATVTIAATAHAQVGLPSLPVPVPGVLRGGLTPTVQEATGTLRDAGARVRQLRLERLLRTARGRVEADPAGFPVRRGEVLAYDPTEDALARARALGFDVRRERQLPGLETRVVVLGTPAGRTLMHWLRVLRASDPETVYELNPLYVESASSTDGGPTVAVDPVLRGTRSGGAATAGLVDGGLERAHPALRASDVVLHGCDGRDIPSAHGTAVASLLVGNAPPFQGGAPGARLYAADVYCGDEAGGALDEVVDALGWLAAEHVPVINVSLVGPANRILERVVARLVARGVAVVAAVGNDGPASPPLYPAAYPGVVAVTGVDPRDRVLPEACRGTHVAFAAPGDLVAAAPGGGYAGVRGTSFAAPLVAGLLALELHDASTSAAVAAAVERLAQDAVDLGARGPDPVYGRGLVARDRRHGLADLGTGATATARH
jgi:subtilisin family serine protease